MLVFIDESGDPGFKIGSSVWLVIAMVIFDDYGEADKTRNMIVKLKKETKVKPEFKFSSCSDKNKRIFFENIKNCKFSVYAIAIKKSVIYSDHLKANPRRLYNYALNQLIKHNKLHKAKVRIDGNSKKEFLKEAKTYLRNNTPDQTIEKLKFLNSLNEPLIQLADMVTGAIARPLNRPESNNASDWENIIKKRVRNVWKFQ